MNNFRKVDAHHHLWDLNLNGYPWLTSELNQDEFKLLGDYSSIKKSYLLDDYLRNVKNYNIVKSVHIQAGWNSKDPIGETAWLQAIADQYGYPHGIVVYADLSDPNLANVLAAHCNYKNVRGIRQILRWHDNNPTLCGTNENYFINNSWREGYELLNKYNLSFDMLIYPHQIDDAVDLVKDHRETSIIINHLCMPGVCEKNLEYWKAQLSKLAQYENVSIKLSGFGILSRFLSTQEIASCVRTAIDVFGVDRCMFASNLPVANINSNIDMINAIFNMAIKNFDDNDKEKIFYSNAVKIYRL